MPLLVPNITAEINAELVEIPNNALLISDKVRWTPQALREEYPNAKRIFVLDFPVLFDPAKLVELQQAEESSDENSLKELQYIRGPNHEILGLIDSSTDQTIINIDHHSEHSDFIANISTTHQALIFANVFKDQLPTNEDVILINHPDTDGSLAIFTLTNPDMAELLKIALSHAAIAADHSGEDNELVTLIDSTYKNRNLPYTLFTIYKYLVDKGIQNLPTQVRTKFYEEKMKRELAEEIVKNKQYKVIGDGVIVIERNDGEMLLTITMKALLAEYGVLCNVIIIASPKDAKFKLNVRAGLQFPSGLTLQAIAKALDLRRYGYAGRALAGGNERLLDEAEPIEPTAFAELIANFLESYKESSEA